MTTESAPAFPWREALLAWNPVSTEEAAHALGRVLPTLPEFAQPAGTSETILLDATEAQPIELEISQTRLRRIDERWNTIALDVRGQDPRLEGRALIGLWPKERTGGQTQTPAWLALFDSLKRGGYVAVVCTRCERLPVAMADNSTSRSGKAVLDLYDLWLLDNPLSIGGGRITRRM